MDDIGIALSIAGIVVGLVGGWAITHYYYRRSSKDSRIVLAHLDHRFEAAGLNPGQREALLRGPIDREWLVEVVGEEGADTRMGKWIVEESKKPLREKDELAMMWGLTAIIRWLEHNAEVAVDDPNAVWIGPPDEGPWFMEFDEDGNEIEREQGYWGYVIEREEEDDDEGS